MKIRRKPSFIALFSPLDTELREGKSPNRQNICKNELHYDDFHAALTYNHLFHVM